MGLRALVEVLPKLSNVQCYDLYPEAARRFIEEMSPLYPKFHMVACSTPAEMIEYADVVVTAIPIVTEPKPPLHAGMLKEGSLAVSLDYDSAWESPAMKECDKFVSDDIDQLLATKEEGIYFSGIPESIYADLGELAAGVKPGRQNEGEKIFSMNMGIAVDDMVTAKMVYERALQKGIGTRWPL
jgi:ornithine cyclodeaminase/alanine dehydrogenase